jgi:hypothetical protein
MFQEYPQVLVKAIAIAAAEAAKGNASAAHDLVDRWIDEATAEVVAEMHLGIPKEQPCGHC